MCEGAQIKWPGAWFGSHVKPYEVLTRLVILRQTLLEESLKANKQNELL